MKKYGIGAALKRAMNKSFTSAVHLEGIIFSFSDGRYSEKSGLFEA